jgi:hypothetical protein
MFFQFSKMNAQNILDGFVHGENCDCLICIGDPRLPNAVSEVLLVVLRRFFGEDMAAAALLDLLQAVNEGGEDEPEEIAAVDEERHPAMDLALDALPPPLVDLTREPHRAPPVVDLTVEPLIDLTFDVDEEITID